MNEKFNEVLKDKVHLSIGLIGTGNAGGQFVAAAAKRGYDDIFCINSSLKDMDGDVLSDTVNCFMVGSNGRGAGLNRSVAKDLFKINISELMDVPRFKEICEKNDVIVVGTSCSGGTGSGVSPILVKMIKKMYPQKIVIFYGILPRLSASPVELANAASCLNEVEQLNAGPNGMGIPYMLVDLNYFDGVSTEEAYPAVINKMVFDMDVISGKYLNPSQYRMIDENDCRVVISSPGYMSIYSLNKITQQQIDKIPLLEMLIKEIKHSPAVDVARDGLIEQMAFISNMPADFDDGFKSGNYKPITDYAGTPLSIFENYAVVPGGSGQFIAIFAGQSYPVGHMSRINEILTKGAEDRKAKLEARKSFDGSAAGTYGFFQDGSRSTAALIDQTQKASDDDDKAKILDGLFD